MNFDTEDLINEPDAPRLINGLRDTGYNFKTAAADIIDNSVAANADEIYIRVELLPDGRKFVFFGDNGDGMDAVGVHSALKYGAPVRENSKSLGKFGLGLKTASSSVCKHFAVISRESASQDLVKLAWDLDYVEAVKRWEMSQDPITPHELETYEELCGAKGTLIVWSNCDRILQKEYDEPGGTKEQQAIKRLADSLMGHVGMIYHRFLDPDDERERNITIMVNDQPVAPWNPFFPARAEQVLSEEQQQIEVELADGSSSGIATIRAWILPHRADLSSEEQGIAKISNKAQGFYIYRENRLIVDGGWMGVFGVNEPHTSLLRIEFDFGSELDDAFHVDVKKSRILFDPGLEDFLKELLQPIYREAGNRYRRKKRQQNVSAPINHTSSNRNIAGTANTSRPNVDEVDPAGQSALIANNRGEKIRIKQPVQSGVSPDSIHVEAVENITTGDLWQPAFRSPSMSGHVAGVILNKHHDFYQKIYQRAKDNGYAVEGMDFLLWGFAAAELNNTDSELEPIFTDIREEISSNLRKLLRDVPLPSDSDLSGDD